MKVYIFLSFLIFLFGFCKSAIFDEDLSKKLINFVAATFISSDFKYSFNKDLAEKCFEKSYPFGRWDVGLVSSMHPCAGKLADGCQLVVAISKPLKMIVFAVGGTFNKDLMQQNSGNEEIMELMDWPRNATLGKVNRHIYYAADYIWGENYLNKFLKKRKGYKIIFTGHSIGGAIASLLALKARILNLVDDNEMSLYTFGEPRSGNSLLAKIFKIYISNSYRIVHSNDILPHLPFCDTTLSPGCRNKAGKPNHRSQGIFYKDSRMIGGQYIICSSDVEEEPSCDNEFYEQVINREQKLLLHLHYYQHLDIYGQNGCT